MQQGTPPELSDAIADSRADGDVWRHDERDKKLSVRKWVCVHDLHLFSFFLDGNIIEESNSLALVRKVKLLLLEHLRNELHSDKMLLAGKDSTERSGLDQEQKSA